MNSHFGKHRESTNNAQERQRLSEPEDTNEEFLSISLQDHLVHDIEIIDLQANSSPLLSSTLQFEKDAALLIAMNIFSLSQKESKRFALSLPTRQIWIQLSYRQKIGRRITCLPFQKLLNVNL